MKKFFMIAVMAIAALTVNAQSNSCQEVGSVSIKPFAGLTLANFNCKDLSHNKMRVGFTVGAEAQYMANEWLGISGGVAYTQQGCKFSESGATMTVKFDYINVPILANFYFLPGLAVKAGIQPGFLVSHKGTLSYNNASATENMSDYDGRKFDLAIPVGLSYEISNVVLDARYNVGAISLNNGDGDPSLTNGVFQFTVGYRF